ncbi:MAG TPA: GAF domain-containing protein, partial [Anaerolineales bacterium]
TRWPASAVTAAPTPSIGIFLGRVLRRRWVRRQIRQDRAAAYSWQNAAFSAGRHNLAMLLALYLSGHMAGLADHLSPAAMLATWPGLVEALLLFAGIHAVSFLAGAVLRYPHAFQALKQDLYTLILIEIVPLPFILIAVLAFPVMGISALAVLGGIPIIISVLLYRMADARTDLERRLQELSTLHHVSEVLRSTLNLEKLLSAIHLQVSQLMDVDNFYVSLYQSSDDQIWYPLAVKHGERQEWSPRRLSDRLTDRVIRERRPIMLPSRLAEEISLADMPPSEETPTAWIGVPLIASERVIGCLALFSLKSQAEFSEGDLDLLITLSGQISVAIENSLLYEQTQRRAAELETLNRLSKLITASLDFQEVLAQVCRSVTEVGGGQHSAVFLVDTSKSEVTLAHAHYLSETFSAANRSIPIAQDERTRCLLTGKPNLVLDLREATLRWDLIQNLDREKIMAFGDFPLVTPEGQIGFLSVYFDSPHVFIAEEVELLQTYASQAAVAVSNARLHARTDLALSLRVNQLSILEAVGRELAAAAHSEQLFEMILSYARDLTNSPWGSLGIYNPVSEMIEIKAKSGYQDNLDDYPVQKGVSGRAFRTRQAINARNARQDPDFVDLTSGASHSQLSLPLIHEGRVLGVLTLESPQLDGYSDNDQAFIEQLANQAAIAVVNAELYGEAQRRLREQSALYLVSARLAGKLELEGVFQIVRQTIQSFLESSLVGIYLWDEQRRTYAIQPGNAAGPSFNPELLVEEHQTSLKEAEEHLPVEIPEDSLGSLASTLIEPGVVRFTGDQALPQALCTGCMDCQALVLPMTSGPQRLGLVLAHLPSAAMLREDELQMLRAMVAQAVIAMQNALLFSDVTHGRDRLAAVLNSVHEGIIMIEMGGYITLVNEAIQTITGLVTTDLAGKRLLDLPAQTLRRIGYTSVEARDLIDSLGKGQVLTSYKVTFKVSEAKPERVLERIALPVWGRSGLAIGWMLVLRDVSEEHQIAQTREIITDTLVHDLRSPLSAVMSALDVIEEGDPQEPGAKPVTEQAINIARRSSQRILGMIESLLDISRMQSGSMELNLTTVDLGALTTATLADYIPQANEFGILLRNEIPANLPPVCADLSKLTRVLINLLDNALKFTPSGGQVVFSAETSMAADMLSLKVSDSGPGVPQDFREKIFERFTQVPGQRGRRRGSGLGLTFCRLAVEAHGGQIWVEPRPGGGSIFVVTLPVAKDGNDPQNN